MNADGLLKMSERAVDTVGLAPTTRGVPERP